MLRFVVAGLLVAALVALVGVGFLAWIGPEGGLTPVPPASPTAEAIQDLYVFTGAVASFFFLIVAVPLVLFLVRFRSRDRRRDVEGPQIRGDTRLEILWTAVPALFVVALTAFTAAKLPSIEGPAGGGGASLRIRVEGHLFYWRYVYPNGVVSIDRLRLPVDRRVELEITAPAGDVNHSFWVPALGGKVDALPGSVNSLVVRPSLIGVFDGKCAEFCGIQHGVMLATAEVMPRPGFDGWLRRTARAQRAGTSSLGPVLWERVCLKCHFAAPEYAPNLAGNPLLTDPDAIRAIVRNGQGRMPAVGQVWTEREMRALIAFLTPEQGERGGSRG